MKLSSLKKRGWKPWIVESSGKWYTGYDNPRYYERISKETIITTNDPHEVRTLKITPVHTATGRSAANMIFEDIEGFQYVMSLGGGFALVKRLIAGNIKSEGEYIICDFVQTKKGSNIFIEALEEDLE